MSTYDTTLDPISPTFDPTLFGLEEGAPVSTGSIHATSHTGQPVLFTIVAPLTITTDGHEVPVRLEDRKRSERSMVEDVLWHAGRAKPSGARWARRNIRPLRSTNA